MSALTIAGLTKAFGAVTVLHGVDLHVPSGSLTVSTSPQPFTVARVPSERQNLSDFPSS